MIILVGASASGKTEIAKILVEKFNYHKCITTTTREKRASEVAGVSYHFVSKSEFNNLLINNAFVEVITYQNNFYGTQKKDLQSNSIIILDPNGANAVSKHLNNLGFVVLIKSKKKLRKVRMLKRGDNLKSIRLRLRKDDQLFQQKNLVKIDLVLLNKDEPLEKLAKIIDQAYKNAKKER